MMNENKPFIEPVFDQIINLQTDRFPARIFGSRPGDKQIEDDFGPPEDDRGGHPQTGIEDKFAGFVLAVSRGMVENPLLVQHIFYPRPARVPTASAG